jgi:hypothetical protein
MGGSATEVAEVAAGFDEDDDGPVGNHGAVACAVCSMPGWLMSAGERGFLIRHDGSPFPHRAPR